MPATNLRQSIAERDAAAVLAWARSNAIILLVLLLVVIALIMQHSDETKASAQAARNAANAKHAEQLAACQSRVNKEITAGLASQAKAAAQASAAYGKVLEDLETQKDIQSSLTKTTKKVKVAQQASSAAPVTAVKIDACR